MSFLDLAKGRVHTKNQTGFSQKLLCQSEPTFYESFQVQGNENLMTLCWSHDQDGSHAHIVGQAFEHGDNRLIKSLIVMVDYTMFMTV